MKIKFFRPGDLVVDLENGFRGMVRFGSYKRVVVRTYSGHDVIMPYSIAEVSLTKVSKWPDPAH